MPYNGTAGQLMDEVCAYLSKLDRQIEVWPNVILNRSTERTSTGQSGSHLVFRIDVRSKKYKPISGPIREQKIAAAAAARPEAELKLI